MGHSRQLDPRRVAFGLAQLVDIPEVSRHVSNVPLGDIKSFAKNNLLGPKLRRSFLSQVSNSLIRLRATLAALLRIEKVIGPGEA
jgi:hypothetical protein